MIFRDNFSVASHTRLRGSSVGTDRSRPRPESAVARLVDRLDDPGSVGDVLHIAVRIGESGETPAAVSFWKALDDRLPVLATDPGPDGIEDGAFDDRFDVLARCDVPSPVVAARLMRIDVGKELEPTSTVTIETDDGDSVDARSWLVEIVDDGSPPGWDEPARIAATDEPPRPDEDDRTTDSRRRPAPGTSAEGSKENVARESREDPDSRETGVTEGAVVSAEPGEVTDGRDDAEGQPGSQPRRDPERTRTGDVTRSHGGEAPTVPADADAPGQSALPGSVDVRLTHLESKVQTMEGYVTVLEQFVDEHGTPRRAFDGLRHDLEALASSLDHLQSAVDDVDDRHRSEMAAIADRVQLQAERVGDTAERVEETAARVETQGERLEGHGERIDDHERHLADLDERIGTLEATAGRLFALQRAQWEDLRERIETLESRHSDRIESLEGTLEERNHALRRTLAAWITDAELELFEIDERVSDNEAWRHAVAEAVGSEPDPE